MEELNSQKSRNVTKQVTHNSMVADLEGKLAEAVSHLSKDAKLVNANINAIHHIL